MTDGPGYYEQLAFNSPLSDHRADAIAHRLATHRPADVLDVGCGWGELLLRVLVGTPDALGSGVDTDDRLLERARAAAEARGLTDRAFFTHRSAAELTDPADLVICIGSSHALDENPTVALARLHELVQPGGRLLLGEGFWELHGDVDQSLVWDDMLAMPDLGGLVDRCIAAGFRPLYVERANADEWDAFESSYLADIEEWLMTCGDHPRAGRERQGADEHRRRWLHGYRNGLGFAYLTLGVPG